MTRLSEVSRDLHILPPPLIPPPPEEPRPPPDESWLPQPLPVEKRGLEELEVPGTSGWGGEPGLEGPEWGRGYTPSSVILVKSRECVPVPLLLICQELHRSSRL